MIDYMEDCVGNSKSMDLLQEILKEQRLWEVDKLSYDIYVKELKRAYKKRFGRRGWLDWETEEKLIIQAEKGDNAAINDLVIANLGIVIHEARKFQNLGLTLNDLISEGNFGLFKAAQRCKNRGFRFSTYARHYIRASIRQAIMQYGTSIHYSSNTLNDFHKIQRFISTYYLQNGYPPSDEDIADSLNMAIEKVSDLRYIVISEVSIDAFSDYVNNLDLFESLFLDRYIYETDSDMQDESLQIEVLETLAKLSEREQEILKMFFGIGCEEMELTDIGVLFNCTRERIRQIKEKAIRKLKGRKSASLRCYL